MWGVQSDFASPFTHSGLVQFLESGGGLWFAQQSRLPYVSSLVRFGSWAEPDSYWRAEDAFNDGRVERFQQLLWQVELPQLVKEVQTLLGLFYNGVYVIVQLEVLGEDGAQEPEWLHCSHSAVHDSEWRESREVSPEVHDHLHCFERVKLQVVKTASDSQLLNLLSVSRLITVLDEADQCGVVCKLQELDRGVFRCAVRQCRDRRAVGREHSPEELQCWSYGCWMRFFPASLPAVCLSGSCWSTDIWRWAIFPS